MFPDHCCVALLHIIYREPVQVVMKVSAVRRLLQPDKSAVFHNAVASRCADRFVMRSQRFDSHSACCCSSNTAKNFLIFVEITSAKKFNTCKNKYVNLQREWLRLNFFTLNQSINQLINLQLVEGGLRHSLKIHTTESN